MQAWPIGIHERTGRRADLEALLKARSAGGALQAPFGFVASLAEPNLSNGVSLALESRGGPIAYAEALRLDQPYVRIWMRYVVHPNYPVSQWGTTLYEALLERSTPGGAAVLEQIIDEGDTDTCASVEALGFTHRDTYTRWVSDLGTCLPAPTFPAGLTVRTVGHQQGADEESWANIAILRRHYGETTDMRHESHLAFLSHLALKIPSFDPPIYHVALEGPDAGAICSVIPSSGIDRSAALIPMFAVRRPWRRRGLGTALLRFALEQTAREGARTVEMHVDVDRTPGLAEVCANAGMRERGRLRVYRREESDIR